ncbi:MAG: SMP-30/gluconolactonase/LRE family protein [Deltaproteobacteria bacterium]|nr:SMP-30/gluconolactonase/LRE family protein [Deltaproteobacteria bacterium]
MKKLILLIFSIVFGASIALHSESQTSGADFTLKKKWETRKVLNVPESVIYDGERNILYVSNINGKPTEKNGKGFISRVTLTGEVKELKWITGLNAPKGSGIHGGKLYVADIDRLAEIDIAGGKIINSYQAAGAEFLNDVAIDEEGSVYVSDMSSANSVIYRLKDGKLSLRLKGSAISSPNGLYAEKDRLVVGNSGDGKLKAVGWGDKTITTMAVIGSGIDGIAADGERNHFISDWAGRTSIVKSSGDVVVILDTTPSGINSADITYIKEKKLLIIPTFFDNRLMAYEIEKK